MKRFLSIIILSSWSVAIGSFLLVKPAMAANSGNFTMSLWVNPTGSVASKALVSKAEEFRIFTNASGYPGCQIKTTSWQTAVSSTQSLATSTWSQVVCTYDLVNLKIYVNGVLKATQALTSLPDDTAASLLIGQDSSSGTTYTNFAGIVDEFKFYNYALTSDEVNTEFNRGAALQMGSLSDTSGLSGGSVASTSASAQYCIPGDTTSCAPPVAEWNFEEGQGTSVADNSGNGNTGTWYGSGAKWGPGKQGKGGVFNGSNDYVNVGTGSTIRITGTQTVEAWVKYTSSADVSVGCWASPTKYAWCLEAVSGKMYWSVSNNGGIGWTNQINSTGTYNDGHWHHISAVFNPSTAIQLYVDGSLAASSTSSIPASLNDPGAVSVIVGGSGANSNYRWSGSIDQVRIFNYARTPAQIAWDYNRGDPVARWKMDECTGTSIKDSSGNGNHGTLTIGPSGSQTSQGTCDDGTSTSAWGGGKTGKFNSSLKFDGTDDFVNVGTNSITGTNPYTLSAWVKGNSPSGYDGAVGIGNGSTNQLAWIGWVNTTQQGTSNSWGGGGYGNNWGTGITDTTNWHLITLTSSGGSTQTFYIYIDGVQKFTTTASFNLASTSTKVGALDDNGTRNYYFSGQIDDVQIFNYALTAVQVKQLYNQNSAVRFGP
jgi:hypothetical protein